jgi:hypothetical protein
VVFLRVRVRSVRVKVMFLGLEKRVVFRGKYGVG